MPRALSLSRTRCGRLAWAGGAPTGIVTHLVTASDWRDAGSYVGRWGAMLFPDTTIVPDAGLEDPHVYLDASGVFHAVFHNQIEADDERLCGGHAYSEDGLEWVFTGTSWSNEVRFLGPPSRGDGGAGSGEGGTSSPTSTNELELTTYRYRFSRVERPHVVFGDAAHPFTITGLTAGVQFGKSAPISVPGQDACFTLFQPVQQQQ